MTLRTRLSVLNLEARDNPSGPDLIDPYGAVATPVVTTNTTVAVDTTIAGVVGGATAVGTTTTDANSIYKVPVDSTLYTQP